MAGMSQYFPDSYPKGRQCDRDYMFNVANTLHQDIVSEIIKHAHSQRYSVDQQNQNKEAIIMSDHWKSELAALPLSAKVS